MIGKLLLVVALASGQVSELDLLFPDLVLTNASGPPSMCGLSASNTEELAKAVKAAPRLSKGSIQSNRFEVYDTADRTQEFVLTLPADPAHPAVACREITSENGELKLHRYMNCSGRREACNQLFLNFRALDSQLRGVPADNLLSFP